MFRKAINFDIRKENVRFIIDAMSAYAVDGVNISNIDCGGGKEMYNVHIRCEKDKFDECLRTVLELSKSGITIKCLVTQ